MTLRVGTVAIAIQHEYIYIITAPSPYVYPTYTPGRIRAHHAWPGSYIIERNDSFV